MLSDEQRALLRTGLAEWGIELSALQMDRFARFTAMLERGNTQLNLTRIRNEDIVALHFLDSLALTAVFRPAVGAKYIDVGTGAGFPGIPLAIVFPEIDVTLVDGTQKRLNFLDGVIADLALARVRTLHSRAEDLSRLHLHHEQYDFVTARAVAKMPLLASYMLPLVRLKGLAVAYKSCDAQAEIEASRSRIASLGGKIEQIADITLPTTNVERKIVMVRKVRSIAVRSSR